MLKNSTRSGLIIFKELIKKQILKKAKENPEKLAEDGLVLFDEILETAKQYLTAEEYNHYKERLLKLINSK